MPEPPRRHALARFLLQLHNILINVLLGAASITALLHHVVDTLVILAVVLVNDRAWRPDRFLLIEALLPEELSPRP